MRVFEWLFPKLCWTLLALLIVGGCLAASANARQAPGAATGVIVSDPDGGTGIHVLPRHGIVFLMPTLPDSFQVCTKFESGGYQNCRSVRELRLPK